jgi:hypothetical protein
MEKEAETLGHFTELKTELDMFCGCGIHGIGRISIRAARISDIRKTGVIVVLVPHTTAGIVSSTYIFKGKMYYGPPSLWEIIFSEWLRNYGIGLLGNGVVGMEVVGAPFCSDCRALGSVVGGLSLMADSSRRSWSDKPSSKRLIEFGPICVRWPAW